MSYASLSSGVDGVGLRRGVTPVDLVGNVLVCASIEEVGKVPAEQEVEINFPRSVIERL